MGPLFLCLFNWQKIQITRVREWNQSIGLAVEATVFKSQLDQTKQTLLVILAFTYLTVFMVQVLLYCLAMTLHWFFTMI